MEDESIKIMPEGFNQFDLNFKIIIVGDSGKNIKIKNLQNRNIKKGKQIIYKLKQTFSKFYLNL